MTSWLFVCRKFSAWLDPPHLRFFRRVTYYQTHNVTTLLPTHISTIFLTALASNFDTCQPIDSARKLVQAELILKASWEPLDMENYWGRLKEPQKVSLANSTTKAAIRQRVWEFLERNDLANFPRWTFTYIPNDFLQIALFMCHYEDENETENQSFCSF